MISTPWGQVQFGDLIQTVAVVVAVGASIVALVISWRDRLNSRRIADADRKNAQAIAAEDRRVALEQAKLMFDLEALVRLLENHDRGGSTDQLERDRLGAQALAIIGTLGPGHLPRLWKRRINMEDAELVKRIEDPSTEEWKRWQFETQLAVNAIVTRIEELLQRD